MNYSDFFKSLQLTAYSKEETEALFRIMNAVYNENRTALFCGKLQEL